MAGKLRHTIIGAIICVILLLAVLALEYAPRGPEQVKKLPDGSVLRLVKVSFGKRDTNYLPMGLLDRIKTKVFQTLPLTWNQRLFKGFVPPGSGGSTSDGTFHTNLDSLHIWITRRDATNGISTAGIERGVIVDDQGCEFPSTQSGGNYAPYVISRITTVYRPAKICDWLTFEAFPRHQRTFRLQLFSDDGKHLADFVVENPAPAPKPAHWTTRPVPMTNLNGDVAFTLADLRIKPTVNLAGRFAQLILSGIVGGGSTYQAPYVIAPEFRVLESGKASDEWQAEDMDLWDSSGNCASKFFGTDSLFLSPHEEAWKLVVKFYGTEHAVSASNTVVKLAGVKVPKRGEFIALDQDLNLAGVTVHPVALAGPGRILYANGTVKGASVVVSSFLGNYNPIDFTNVNGARAVALESMMPQLALRTGNLADDQRLTIRAVDGQGREYYAEDLALGGPAQLPQTNTPHYLELNQEFTLNLKQFTLNLPPEATNVDLYFCIHLAHTEDFIFKPPTNQ